MLEPVDARRRWFGLFYLLIAGGLLIWGQTILEPHLGRGIWFVLYWLTCLIFTGLAILTALLDLVVVRYRSKKERSDLLKQTGVETQKTSKQNPTNRERAPNSKNH